MFHPEGESFLEFASIGNLLGSLKYIGAENIYVRECLFCILNHEMLRKVIVWTREELSQTTNMLGLFFEKNLCILLEERVKVRSERVLIGSVRNPVHSPAHFGLFFCSPASLIARTSI